jgi:hypothetical protein
MGPSVRARRRLVRLGARRGGGQGGRRTCSQPPWRAVALADGVARFVETPVTTLQNQVFISPWGDSHVRASRSSDPLCAIALYVRYALRGCFLLTVKTLQA